MIIQKNSVITSRFWLQNHQNFATYSYDVHVVSWNRYVFLTDIRD